MSKPVITISVRELAEYCTAGGDLIGVKSSLQRALEGSTIHRTLQKIYSDSMPENTSYNKEVTLTFDVEREHYILRLQGRADGIIKGPDTVCIHEIKTTYIPLELLNEEHNPAYAAQLNIYAFIYASIHKTQNVKTRLTYFNMQTQSEKSFEKAWGFFDLEQFFNALIDDYTRVSDLLVLHRERRNTALDHMDFPFENYRPSQREFASQVYTCIKEGNTLYAEAPTGTGKTIGTLFPALKALGKGLCEKVFYLTAKGQTGLVAQDTLKFIKSCGVPLKYIYITGKEKTCLMQEQNCNPDVCEYCKDYYIKQHNALPEILTKDAFDTKTINKLAKKYKICPFELSLTISESCDCIICDYNYVFNPYIRLKRYFTYGPGKYAFLVDEAHNLVERIRETFSTSLSKNEMVRLQEACKDSKRLYRVFGKIISFLNETAQSEPSAQQFMLPSQPVELADLIKNLLSIYTELLEQAHPIPKEFTDYIITFLDYIMVSDYYHTNYHNCYVSKFNNDCVIKLLCLMPAPFVRLGLSLGKGSVLFSATLSPEDYYLSVLGADEKSYFYRIPSPFPREQLLVLVDDTIDTTYSKRAYSYGLIATLIQKVLAAKKGKYLVFFPSYEYMNRVYEVYHALNTDTHLLLHTPNMNRSKKDEFMAAFTQSGEDAVLGFSVMGGHFSEGIDLPGKQLIGVIVVGVGLPTVSTERNLIQEYFNEQSYSGFNYAYVYPGMNKVLQTAGRVIRTAEDVGVVVLIDRRFSKSPYNELLPEHWQPKYLSQAEVGMEEMLDEFWLNQ